MGTASSAQSNLPLRTLESGSVDNPPTEVPGVRPAYAGGNAGTIPRIPIFLAFHGRAPIPQIKPQKNRAPNPYQIVSDLVEHLQRPNDAYDGFKSQINSIL